MDITLLVTILIGIPGIIIWIKRYQRKLIFVREDLINLYSSIARNLSDLKITFKGKEINEYIYLVRGFIFCKGKKDITRNEIEKYPYISLSNNSNWLDYKILSSSEDLQPTIIQNNKNLEFHFNLIKNNEFIYFQGLFEANEKDDEIDKTLILKHRIAHLGSVKKIKSITTFKTFIFNAIVWIIGSISFSYISFDMINNNKLERNYLTAIIYNSKQPSKQITEEEFWNSNLADTLEKELVSIVPIPDTIGKKIAIIKESVIDEYSLIDLIFQSTTKKYKIYDVYLIEFYLNYNKLKLIFPFIVFLSGLFFLFSGIFYISEYFRFKKLIRIIKVEKQKLKIDVGRKFYGGGRDVSVTN